MTHRIGARGILVSPSGDQILLALEDVAADGKELWVPPGGGLEPEDGSLIACLRREFREETGLTVEVGPMLYAREYSEPSRQSHHLGLFFLVHSPQGERHQTDRDAPPQGADLRRHTEWFTQDELKDLFVRPEDLRDGAWIDHAAPGARYVGVGHEDGSQSAC